jgi:type II secretory pathway pseudopilin PulG
MMPTPSPVNHSSPGNRDNQNAFIRIGFTRNAFTQNALRVNGFTLVELLVVIGIIIILMGILLPVVSRMRRAAYAADTANEISQLSNACNQYYATFHAYPGPLSNDYIDGVNATTAVTLPTLVVHPLESYNPAGAPQFTPFTPANYNITGSENLVLGLMGGLRLDTAPGKTDPSVSPTIPYLNALAPTEVGLGPLNLNPAFPGRTPSFFSNGTTYLMWCEAPTGGQPSQTTTYLPTNSAGTKLLPIPFNDQANTQSLDSPIPEFVDRFPSPGPLPILYLRARVGAKGVVSNGVIKDPTNPTIPAALYQYDVREIAAYTQLVTETDGQMKSIGLGAYTPANPIQHCLQDVGTPAIVNPSAPPNSPPYYTMGDFKHMQQEGIVPKNAGPYFFNSSIPPTDPTSDASVNNTGRPRAVDQFILISAGPDGIYGTADDITSVGDVSQ